MKSQNRLDNGANLGFEEKLWQAADKLRLNMDTAEYKHVVLGLIFLKYISDSFEEKHGQLSQDKSSDPEDRDEYLSVNIFWVPKYARWKFLQKNAKDPSIGMFVDDAMLAIEKENNSIRGVLPKDYARPAIDKTRLGELIDLLSGIGLSEKENRSMDLLGRVYEYFLGKFAMKEGHKSGQFYTPRSVVRILVEMIEPYNGRIFDPCCGSGGMFVQSERFVQSHGGKIRDISIYGQESNQTTWRLCKMNLAIRGIDAKIEWNSQGSFLNDAFKDLKADYILANPPFNDSDWGGERLREDVRWIYGVPPVGNSNIAWIQHFIHHLSPNGIAGFVLANTSLTSEISNEGQIRKAIIEADLVDCIITLPDKLFYNATIAPCLWFITKNKNNSNFRKRKNESLFIDATHLGQIVDRKHREMSNDEIRNIVEKYHKWRGESTEEYKDILGLCKSVSLDEIRNKNYSLNPSVYVGFQNIIRDQIAHDDRFLAILRRDQKSVHTQNRKKDH
jgi:type I restriction enzyme M protein